MTVVSTWTPAELEQIGRADELHVAGERADGTLRDPVTIWFVVLDGSIYVRSIKGKDGAWLRGAQVRHEGRITVGDWSKDVVFVEADATLNDDIDEAYRVKYARWPGPTASILTEAARESTLRVEPKA